MAHAFRHRLQHRGTATQRTHLMEADDVPCPMDSCQADIGEPCINRLGGPLGYSGPTQKAARHIARWETLSRQVSEWEAMEQGELKLALLQERRQVDQLRTFKPLIHDAADYAAWEMKLKARRNRYLFLWNLLDEEHRPQVIRYQPPTNESRPHPELIDCPQPGCDKKKGEKCLTDFGDYHLLRIRRSPA